MIFDRAELRKRAGEATTKEWTHGAKYLCEKDGTYTDPFAQCIAGEYDSPAWEAKAAYIVAAQPSTVLALLDRIEELEADRARAVEKLTHALMVLEPPTSGSGKRAWASLLDARKALSGEKP